MRDVKDETGVPQAKTHRPWLHRAGESLPTRGQLRRLAPQGFSPASGRQVACTHFRATYILVSRLESSEGKGSGTFTGHKVASDYFTITVTETMGKRKTRTLCNLQPFKD